MTRGTTGSQRLRRVDRWLLGTRAGMLLRADDPLVVDLGFGAAPVTTLELWSRLRRVRPDVEVVGVEIDAHRVAAAQPAARPGLSFVHGGFELPLPGGRRPVVIRALNVLRQYDEGAVTAAWAGMLARLAPGGLLLEGTCDELGRLASWVVLDSSGPRELVTSRRLAGAGPPSDLAQRLPKALIHRNVPGEGVHALLQAFDRAHEAAAPWAPFGPRVRAVHTARLLVAAGWPVTEGPGRWRLGELGIRWEAVDPQAASPRG